MNTNESLTAGPVEESTERTRGGGPINRHDRSLAHSIGWNAISDWGSQIVSWASFLVVMRLLTPKDFGIAGLSLVMMPYLALLTGLGIGRTVVMLRDLTEDQCAQLNSVSFGLSFVYFGVAALIAKPLAVFFKTPPLAPVMMVASIGLFTGGLQVVSGATLLKQMRFRLFSLLGAGTAVLTALLTMGFAVAGLGYWALILGNLIGGMVRTAVLLTIRPCRLAWPRLASIREPLKFGWHVTVSMLASSSYQRMDNVVAGRVLGQTALGLYASAWELAAVPIEKVTSLVTNVIPTYLAAIQDQPAALRRYLRGLTEVIALATFPATFGLSLVASDLVPLLFGAKWEGMIGPLQVLSFYYSFRSIVALLPNVLTAVGGVRYVMWNDVAALLILTPSFYLGSRFGINGISWSWVFAYPLVAIPLYRKTFRAIEMSFSSYFAAIRPALVCTVIMAISVGSLKYYARGWDSKMLRLCAEVAIGAAVYSLAVWLLHRRRLRELLGFALRLKNNQPSNQNAT